MFESSTSIEIRDLGKAIEQSKPAKHTLIVREELRKIFKTISDICNEHDAKVQKYKLNRILNHRTILSNLPVNKKKNFDANPLMLHFFN